MRSGQYGNTIEYLHELTRRDQEDQAKKCLGRYSHLRMARIWHTFTS